jgi:hypothetical protein
MSSEEGGFGLAVAEKFFGLILVIIGALAVYYTFTGMDFLGAYTGFFGFLSITLLAIGVVLITARTE